MKILSLKRSHSASTFTGSICARQRGIKFRFSIFRLMLHRNLQYLHRKQIDTRKWDQCITNAANGLIYARSFYLDTMASNWDALVLGDYEAVMPLTWRKK